MNVNGRFEYEMCFRKIRSSVVEGGSKNSRLNVCYDLKEQVGNGPQILSKVVTRDETWCYAYDPETKQASSHGKLPILQKQSRPNKFDEMLRSC